MDDESKSDLLEAFLDLQAEIEACILKLQQGDDEDNKEIHSLFRAIHNIKGNAGIMGLQSIVDFAHQVEDVAGALRQGNFAMSAPIAESFMLAMDRLHDLHQMELYGEKFEHVGIDELKAKYYTLARASQEDADELAEDIVCDVNGFQPRFGLPDEVPAAGTMFDTDNSENSAPPDSNHSVDTKRADLFFFQELALQLDNLVEEWENRSIQLFDWAMKMNNLAGQPIDELQFAAAIYMHDIGLGLIPRDQLLNHPNIEPSEDDVALRSHPSWAYNILSRMKGWEEAALIVLQHHERIDGSGYPSGLVGEQIHDGAKILGILDTFFSLTKGFVSHESRNTTVNALNTINQYTDTKFEGMWVQCFNHVLRKELKAGNI